MKKSISIYTSKKHFIVETNNDSVIKECKNEVKRGATASYSSDRVPSYGGVMNFIKHLKQQEGTFIKEVI